MIRAWPRALVSSVVDLEPASTSVSVSSHPLPSDLTHEPPNPPSRKPTSPRDPRAAGTVARKVRQVMCCCICVYMCVCMHVCQQTGLWLHKWRMHFYTKLVTDSAHQPKMLWRSPADRSPMSTESLRVLQSPRGTKAWVVY